MKAILPIRKGEQIYTRYTTPQLTSLRRQFLLQSQWYFSCDCRRCQDPTECGTMGNAISCSFNHGEKIDKVQHIMLPKNPRYLESDWVCMTDAAHIVDSNYPKQLTLEVEQFTKMAEQVQFW